MQASVFWLSGIAFFAVQAATLLYLLRARRSAPALDEGRRAEIVWTLVPAAMLAALALMIGGLTQGSWTRVRGSAAPIARTQPAELRVLGAAPAHAAVAERR